jgi:hypothetical protein
MSSHCNELPATRVPPSSCIVLKCVTRLPNMPCLPFSARVAALQEADSRKIACRPERRAAFAAELQAIIPDALQLLTRCAAEVALLCSPEMLQGLWCSARVVCSRLP